MSKKQLYKMDFYNDSEKPQVREKLLAYGVDAISDIELLMILIGNGQKGIPVKTLAEKTLKLIQTEDTDSLQAALLNTKGLGQSKSASILAALEFSRRFRNKPLVQVLHPADIIPLIQIYAYEPTEHFICILLNGAHEATKVKVITVGTLNRSIIHPREIFATAITNRAAAIILAHNHPSGSLNPSKEDMAATISILAASKTIGIPLLDHVIVTKSGYFSFAEKTDIFAEVTVQNIKK